MYKSIFVASIQDLVYPRSINYSVKLNIKIVRVNVCACIYVYIMYACEYMCILYYWHSTQSLMYPLPDSDKYNHGVSKSMTLQWYVWSLCVKILILILVIKRSAIIFAKLAASEDLLSRQMALPTDGRGRQTQARPC